MFVRNNRRLAIVSAFIAITACNSAEQKTKPVEPTKTGIREIQEKPAVSTLDKSPMDMSYFPPDYPIMKMSGKTNEMPVARIIYSRPSKDGRIIFGNVVKYGEHWRLGANEATEIEFFSDVLINKKKVTKGRYILYCIPFRDKWTLVLNNDLFVWGLKIHTGKDVATFDIPITQTDHPVEVFTMQFEPMGARMHLVMAWDNVKAELPIQY